MLITNEKQKKHSLIGKKSLKLPTCFEKNSSFSSISFVFSFSSNCCSVFHCFDMVWCRSLVVCIPGQSRVAVSFDASELASVGLLVAKLSIPQSVLDGGVSFVAGGKLYKAPDETFPQHVSRVDLHVSMCGGKGGFGALLRGGVTETMSKTEQTNEKKPKFFSFFSFFFFFSGPGGLRTRKTTNFDACRDLSGRRLRHAKAEERLRDWAVKQMEKEKAKQAEAAAKKADKMLHKQQVVHAFAEESQQLSERTATALQRGLEAKKKIQLMMAREEAKRELASKAQQNPWDVDGDDQQEEDDEGYEDEEEINKDEDFVIHDQVKEKKSRGNRFIYY